MYQLINEYRKSMKNNLLEYKNWLEKRNLTLNTIRSYLWAIKEYEPRELNTDTIITFLKENLTKYQPASLQVFRQALSSYAKFQKIEIEWEMINRIIPTVQRKFFTTIDEKELEQLKQARYEKVKQVYHRNNLMLDFLFYMGFRVRELVNVKHSDYQDKSLKIHGKGNKIRHIPVPDFLIRHFNSFSDDYLFTTKNNKKLDPIQVRTMIYKKTKKAGISKHISPHTFRRSFATLLNNKEVRLTTIQKLLGHSSIETTTGYIHNSYEELYKDYSKLWQDKPFGKEPEPRPNIFN